ncbi:MAG: DNA polymerase I [Patescibacteria group bacterium]
MSKKQRILLIDGHALIHRAYHALPPLTTKSGELVGAVFGFTSVLLKAIRELKPTHIAVAFDAKGPTFRHKEYKEYKATRVAAPQDLYDQIPRVKQVVEVFNIPYYEMPGFEADDLIGTLSKKLKIENIVVTGDLDELQLVDRDTKVYTMRRGVQDTVMYDEKKVFERYGLKPEQLIDFKGLRGDPSDNIPGVKGIGEKTAAKLLSEFGNLEKLYQAVGTSRAKNVSEKLQKLLIEQKDRAFLSRKLATIITDIKLDFDFKKCELSDYDKNKVVKLFQELGFKSLLARLPESKHKGEQTTLFKIPNSKFQIPNKSQVSKSKTNYQLVDTQEKFEKFLSELIKQKEFVIDTETTSASAMEAKLIGLSFCWKEKEAYYLPILNLKSKISNLKGILENPEIKKIAHNAKYDLLVLKNFGINLQGVSFDTILASYILLPGSRRHSLDDLAFQEFGYQMMSFEDLVGKGKKQKKIEEVEIEKLCFYSCEDADFTFRLYKLYKEKLKKEPNLEKIFYDIEMPLLFVLSLMEENGVKLDEKFLQKLSKDFGKELEKTADEIYKLAGTRDFNISSTQQLQKILFEKLKINSGLAKKIKTGISTAASELAKLHKAHPIIPEIEKYREYTKLKNTYIDALPALINQKTGKVHTSFNQTITSTGRLSSSGPNLQNIPIRTEIGQQIRKAFIANLGFKILSADYSQIELRLAAHISGDPNMLAAFDHDEDIHSATAAKIFKKEIKKITKQERRFAKTINFGILYGMSPYGLSQVLDIDREEAQLFINQYFQNFPSIAIYIRNTLEFARKNGYVQTLLGRKRYLPELVSGSPQIQSAAERMAINAPIQGSSADIIKMAMNELNRKNLVQNPECKLLLQVHDELVFEIKEEKLRDFAQRIKKIMENIYKLQISLKVDLSYGRSWGELENI